MYDLNKRSYFTTLGELRMLLADLPDDTRIYACGDEDCFLHVDGEGKIVSIDYDALDSDYDECFPAEKDDSSLSEEQYALMMIEHVARLAVLQNTDNKENYNG